MPCCACAPPAPVSLALSTFVLLSSFAVSATRGAVVFAPCGPTQVAVAGDTATHEFVTAQPGTVGGQPAVQFVITVKKTAGDRWGAIGYRAATNAGPSMRGLTIMGCDTASTAVNAFATMTANNGAPTLAGTPDVDGGYSFAAGIMECRATRLADAVLQFDTPLTLAHASGLGAIPSTWTKHVVRALSPGFTITGCPTAAPLVVCTAHTCNTGFALKAAHASLMCGLTAADCNDALCCDFACSHTSFTCGGTSVLKGGAENIVCGSTFASCTDLVCCGDVLCGTFVCSPAMGYQDKAGKAGLACGNTAADCTTDTCCDVTCTNAPYVCTVGVVKAAANAITCGAATSDCADATCCDYLVCTMHTCAAGWQPKALQASLICPGTPSVCSDATCCDAVVLCGTHTCSGSFQDKTGKAAIVCSGMPPVCDDATCC
eukprot:Rhum_TRINITY_DN15429_c3_g6::Rhum_TRINITY_DN15429_c3_g6_i1::g.156337::m.156337